MIHSLKRAAKFLSPSEKDFRVSLGDAMSDAEKRLDDYYRQKIAKRNSEIASLCGVGWHLLGIADLENICYTLVDIHINPDWKEKGIFTREYENSFRVAYFSQSLNQFWAYGNISLRESQQPLSLEKDKAKVLMSSYGDYRVVGGGGMIGFGRN